MAAQIKPKKRCCKSNPRCKRCPVVCKRLVTQGLAERRSDGIVLIYSSTRKKQVKQARKR